MSLLPQSSSSLPLLRRLFLLTAGKVFEGLGFRGLGFRVFEFGEGLQYWFLSKTRKGTPLKIVEYSVSPKDHDVRSAASKGIRRFRILYRFSKGQKRKPKRLVQVVQEYE